ncbi:DNA translocase FtsK 4TM domain-containing protein [Moraxella bovis]|nr:DNA translocase FtsK [Moraxella bovis]UYZ69066.1 DNA translocase FtsK 4TM domain-containing protein [Moraxella bovis]UZA26904.1 DNA translocase FtsK 4TM domain-containing protein [Moraxella bovis]WAJ73090.1 DNA translocase FtsK 4TM domain-containing protein [Moraxella bovis]
MKKILQNQKIAEFISQMPIIKRLFFSVFGTTVLGFLFLSLLSYNTLDPAWSHVGGRQEITNVGGRLGAWVADILHVFFGYGSWWLVLVMMYEVALLWWRQSQVMWQLRVLAYGFLLVCLSGLLAGWGTAGEHGTGLISGGVMGAGLYQALVQQFGNVATAIFLLIITGVVTVLAFEVRPSAFFDWFMGWLDGDKKVKPAESVKPNQEDTKLFEVVKDDAPIVSSVHHNSEDLSEFLQTSGLRDEILANTQQGKQDGESQAGRVEIHADEVVLKVDNLTLDANQLHARQADGIHHESESKPLEFMHDDEMIEILNHDSDDIVELTPKTKVKIVSTNDIDEQVNINDNQTVDAKMGIEINVDDEVDFVYQNNRTNQTTNISRDNVFDDEWVKLSKDLLNQEIQEQDLQIDTQERLNENMRINSSGKADVKNDVTTDGMTGILDEELTQPPLHPDNFIPKKPLPVEDTPKQAHFKDVGADAPNPQRSRAMDTLTHRMSLSPIPELSILDKPDANKQPSYTEREIEKLSELLEIKLKEFNIKASVVSAMVGPVVTRFEVELAAGIKASRVTGAAQDLARSLSMASLRVVEVIPGKPYIGIEVPNKKREMVRLIELLDTPDYKNPDKQIGVAIGKDIGGKVVIADLAKAPHMLVAGTTGSGKSVFVNSILLSMLFKYTPDELKLVLIDPKQLELANYGDIPHLLTPVITDMTEATAALTWCVSEMERRYQLMSLLRVRKISEFNKKVLQAETSGEPIFDPLWRADENVSIKTAPKLKPLPLIVIVADEFADMIMQLGKTAEEPIVRLAQKARAAGIHLVLATQRPTVNVVTGLIKANIPSRVALRVNSKVDSRTIIEEGGAESMLGNGDMMFIGPGENTPRRVHGAYVDDDEVNRVCDAWRERGSPDYIDLSNSYTFEGEGSGDGLGKGGDDEYYHQAVTFVMESRKVSISSIQRKLGIGYNRAARIVDMMEEAGLVSPMDNAGKRQILM